MVRWGGMKAVLDRAARRLPASVPGALLILVFALCYYGAYALSGLPAGPWYSYARPQGFHAVGGGGYQPITGLGSPNGVVAL